VLKKTNALVAKLSSVPALVKPCRNPNAESGVLNPLASSAYDTALRFVHTRIVSHAVPFTVFLNAENTGRMDAAVVAAQGSSNTFIQQYYPTHVNEYTATFSPLIERSVPTAYCTSLKAVPTTQGSANNIQVNVAQNTLRLSLYSRQVLSSVAVGESSKLHWARINRVRSVCDPLKKQSTSVGNSGRMLSVAHGSASSNDINPDTTAISTALADLQERLNSDFLAFGCASLIQDEEKAWNFVVKQISLALSRLMQDFQTQCRMRTHW